jgi:hypothetical protein
MASMFKSALTGLKNTATDALKGVKAATMSAGKDALTGVKAATKTAVGESRLALQAGFKDAKKSLTDNAAKLTQVGKQTFDNAAKKVGTLVNSYGAFNNLGMANTSSTPVQGSPKPVQGSPKPVQGSPNRSE